MKNIVCMCFTIICFSLFGIGKSFSDKFLDVQELKTLISGATVETTTSNRWANPVEIKFSANGSYIMSVDGSHGYREHEGKWWAMAPDKFCMQNNKKDSYGAIWKRCYRFKKVGSNYTKFEANKNKEGYPTWAFKR